MNMKKIEIKVLLFNCLLFWILQLVGVEREGTYLFALSLISVILLIAKDKVRLNDLCLYSMLFQIVAFFILRLFRIAKQSNMFDVEVNKIIILQALVIVVLFGAVFTLNKRSVKYVQSKKVNLAYIIMAIAFLIRELMCYIGTCSNLQNDVGVFTKNNDGHLGYIYQFFKYMSLPKGSPEGHYQFYHPPLHHFISGIWAKINSFLGVKEADIPEMIQVLSLFYSMMIVILAYKIMREITKNKRSLLVGTILVSFFPYLIEYSGSVNNDPLCFVLSLMAVLYFIRWYRKSTYKNIILCAVCLGCAMMTKMTAAMLAPPMAIMFIYKLIDNKTKLLKLIKQYIVFGVISIPLGMWFPIKNTILYKMPLNYVLEVPKKSIYDLSGQYSVWNRLFGFSLDQFQTLYMTVDKGAKSYVTNIGIAVTKSATIGETEYFSKSAYAGILETWMYRALLVVCILAIVSLVYWFIKYKRNSAIKVYLLLTVLIGLASYVSFQFAYPATSSMSVRYLITIIVIQIGIIGASVEFWNGVIGKILTKILKVFLIFYAAVMAVGTISLLYRI
ncbi:MAG: glycosyltransferase family 39 protein [Eubacterium sp.]|nr:glycosyltransferase family 39 protein [Eubacterium sp.]